MKPQKPTRRLATVAKLGLDLTPDTIREGTVRMLLIVGFPLGTAMLPFLLKR